MPLFMSDTELEQERGNLSVVVGRADVYIRDLQTQLETHKARADAAAINAEQTCALIEQKFLALSAQFSQLESEKEQGLATLDRRSTELAQAQAQTHKLEIESIKHQSDTERLSFELGELRKAKQELLQVVEQKNAELDEKNASIKSYLNKVVNLTDDRSSLEAKAHELEAEVVRSRATQGRLSQEKWLLEQHNSWLNEELTAKVSALLEERHTSSETEANLRTKLAEAERVAKDAGENALRAKDRVNDLEAKLRQTQEELQFTKEDAAVKEDQLSTEVETATKLVQLYKESSDEWSKKSHDLQGVIKALEAHLNQVEGDYKEKLEKEVKAREELAREAAEVKEKLERTLVEGDTEVLKSSKDGEFLTLTDKPYAEPIIRQLALEAPGAIVPAVASELSGTALAVALLRDGWSLAKMYSKYQEAEDACRHERQERRHSQALLERVLHEIEVRAAAIMDERDEHINMVKAYRNMEEKLHHFMEDQSNLEKAYKDLKAELRKKERDLKGGQKEIADLQTQVAVLLKECSDVQQRFGVGDQNGETSAEFVTAITETTAADVIISDRLLTFRDIRGMVEHNSQLRALVRSLAQQNEQKELELKEGFEAELKKRLDEIGRKVVDTVKRSEEQSDIIDRLQGTVGMYRRLYEEEVKARRVFELTPGVPTLATESSGHDLRTLLESSQEEVGRVRAEATARIKSLEEDLEKARQEITNARVERARADGEASYAREQMASLMRDTENQRKEMETVLARNMEFSQTITDYQRRLREDSQNMQASEEASRRLSIEVSVAEREKELLATAEKRASQEVATLSDRVHRLQATLDTIHSVEDARENVRAAEKKKLEEELNHMQKEWAEAKHDLEVERAHGRNLSAQRDKAVSQALERVDALTKELANALKAVSTAETRAQVAEARCIELESSLKKADEKIMVALGGGKKVVTDDSAPPDIDGEIMLHLQEAREELERIKEDLAASKVHTDQYKKIAEANEEALKQMEAAHLSYRSESERNKEAMGSEMRELRKRINKLEMEVSEKDKAAGGAAEEKEKALSSAYREIASLKDSSAMKQAALDEAEERISTFKQELEKVHHQWREAQSNYERQVLLQADTIRELTSTSKKLSNLEHIEGLLCERTEKAEAELESSQVAWAMEKSSLESAKTDAEKKVKELDEQNQVLLDRLEGMHIVAAETARKAAGNVSDSVQGPEVQGDTDLQHVIRYLRRSKETADTELSLMKQERLRLQKQVDAAYRAAEEAQASLRREHKDVQASIYSDEEFRALQAQIRELNLLRESNAELRAENRKNFEDCREWREKAREAQAELEPLVKRLRESEADLEAGGRTLEVQKAETQRWEKRVTQLLKKYKAVDVDDYQRVRAELAEVQEHEKATKAQLDAARKEIEETKEKAEKLEEAREITGSRLGEVEERERELDQKLQETLQSEAAGKAEIERFKRHSIFLKRKLDVLTKEKEDTSKEVEGLTKQIEELKANAGNRAAGDTSVAAQQEALIRQEATARHEAQKETDTQLKEKESRIQTLEKCLEKEREEVRKERARRLKDKKTFYDVAQKASQEKKRLLDEMSNVRREKEQYELEAHGSGAGSGMEPPVKTDVEEQYEAAVNQIEEVASALNQELTSNSPALVASAPVAITDPSLDVPALIETVPITGEAPVGVGISIKTSDLGNVTAPLAPALSSGSQDNPTASFGAEVFPSVGSVPNNAIVAPSSLAGPRPPTRPGSTSVIPSRPSIRVPPAPGPALGIPQPELKGEKELQIIQLRARIKETEKAQARKTTRKLIRPRIDPVGTQEANAEPGENNPEATVEGTDADVEILEESKPIVPGAEVTESTTTNPLFLSAVANVMASVSAPLAEPAAMTATTSSFISAPPTTTAPVARKRAASSSESGVLDDDHVQQEIKLQDAPPQKKSRAAEDTAMVDPDPLSSEVVVRTAVQEDALLQNLRPSELSVTVSDITLLLPPVSETERERPMTDVTETPAHKRPRFVRPDLALLTSQLTEGQVGEDGKISAIPTSDALGDHEDMPVERGSTDPGIPQVPRQKEDILELGGLSGGVLSEAGNESLPASDGPVFNEEPAPLLAQNLSEETGIAAVSTVAIDPGSLVIDISSANLVDEASARSQTVSPEIQAAEIFVTKETTIISVEEEITTLVEMGSEAEGLQVTEDAEEGEILLELGASEGAAPGPGNEIEATGEGQTEEHSSKAVEEADSPPNDGKSMDDQTMEPTGEGDAGSDHVETEGSTLATTSSTDIGKPENDQLAEARNNGPGEQGIEIVPATIERTSQVAVVTTKPTGRSSTIHLAEQARERSILRRAGVTPPSPGTRGGRGRGQRGGKRAGGTGRGRLISTGVGRQRQEGPGNSASLGGDGTSTIQQTRPPQGSHDEASQPAATSNSFDVLKDEQN